MKPFFQDPARQQLLLNEATTWVGTPFLQNGTLKQVGVSCHYLVTEILFACGIPRVEVPQGSARWGSTENPYSPLDEGFSQADGCSQVGLDLDQLMPGDVLGFRIGNKIHHVGLVVDPGNFIHCLKHLGAQITIIQDDKFTSRLEKVWRFEEWE